MYAMFVDFIAELAAYHVVYELEQRVKPRDISFPAYVEILGNRWVQRHTNSRGEYVRPPKLKLVRRGF